MASRRAARGLALGALAASLTWLLLLAVAPGAAEAGVPWRALAGWTYSAGARVCHQRPERSLMRRGRALPVCARCFGLYLGVPLGLAVALVQHRSGASAARWPLRVAQRGTARSLAGPVPPEPGAADGLRRWLILASVAATLGSVIAEWLGLLAAGPLVRAGLGWGLGAVLSWACVGALLEEASAPGAVN